MKTITKTIAGLMSAARATHLRGDNILTMDEIGDIHTAFTAYHRSSQISDGHYDRLQTLLRKVL